MPSRRQHPKSRNGCQLCKKRRVKCDGAIPSCRNCVRYGSDCSFSESQSTFVSKGTSSYSHPETAASYPLIRDSNKETGSLSSNCTDLLPTSVASSDGQCGYTVPETFNGPPNPSPTFSQNNIGRLSEWLDRLPGSLIGYITPDEELMHNYLTVTYRSISSKQSVQEVYRFDIPKEAASHQHLMHAILALSAANLMHTNTDQQEIFQQKARRHQHLAISSAITGLVDINSSNCHALFATAGIIAFLAFALRSPVSRESQSPLIDIVEFFTLFRGIKTVLQSTCFDEILEGKFGALLHYNWHPPTKALPEDLRMAFDGLKSFTNATIDDPECREMYSATIQSLQYACSTYSIIAQEKTLVFSWAADTTDNYLSLVRKRDPLALVILAYYALLLDSVDGIWWSEGRGAWLIEAISQELPLTWHSLIQFPKDVIRDKRKLALGV